MPPEERTDTIEHAVSQLLKEPEPEKDTASPDVEPEEKQNPDTEEESELETELEEGEEEEAEEESEEDSESEDEPEEEEEEQEEEEPSYIVKIDGEEYEVTLDELQSGYQRQKDYTKKTQAVSEQRKIAEERAEELKKAHEDFMGQASIANELLNRDLKKFESVDWETLKTEDPVGYVQKQIEFQETKGQQEALRQQAQAVWEHNQRIQADEAAKFIESERKEMLKVFPEWSKSDVAEANQNQIVAYGREIGYSDQELSSIVKARDLQVLDKARKYDELQKTKQGITKKKRPAMRKLVKSKGKAPTGAAAKKKVSESRAKLKESGSLKDAARLMYERQQGRTKLSKRK